jgi:UDP-N-acetylmuramoylalanine--D-glutamate ligase
LLRQIHNKHVQKIKLEEGLEIEKNKVKLLGNHNLENIVCASKVAKYLGIADGVIEEVIENFSGLKHRLELIGNFKNILFYDDAISTTPESTIAAIKTFEGRISTLILGGYNRGYDFKKLAKIVLEEKIQNLIFFPESGADIWEEIKAQVKPKFGLVPILPKHFFVNDMKSCVEKAFKITRKGSICLLSCASPSYSIFKNFEDKGDQFARWIKELV